MTMDVVNRQSYVTKITDMAQMILIQDRIIDTLVSKIPKEIITGADDFLAYYCARGETATTEEREQAASCEVAKKRSEAFLKRTEEFSMEMETIRLELFERLSKDNVQAISQLEADDYLNQVEKDVVDKSRAYGLEILKLTSDADPQKAEEIKESNKILWGFEDDTLGVGDYCKLLQDWNKENP